MTGQHSDDQFSCGDGSALRRPIVPRRRIFISRPNIIAPANNHYGNEIFLNLLPRYTAESTENIWYLCTVVINVYVAGPDPDPNPRGGGQLPNPKSAILR